VKLDVNCFELCTLDEIIDNFIFFFLSGVDTSCFSAYCDKDSATIIKTGRLPPTHLETGVSANDCKCRD
jgi:hypothetical protein